MAYIDYIADPTRRCAIVAHRGAWHGAPENSLAAIENAIAIGVDIVELDVRKSADGELFLMHDDTLLRMAGIDRDAETFTIAELQAIALRADDGGDGRALTDQRVPTLKQALEIIRGHIFADLDLKDRGLFSEVAACARDMNAADYVDLKTTVTTQEHVDWVNAQDISGVPFLAMTRFTETGTGDTLALLSGIKPFMSEISFDHIETIESNRAAFEAAGMALWKNTLDMTSSGEWTDTVALADPDKIWGRLIDAGISAIQTDQPAALKAYIEKRA
ncbi:glycerophosphodiester phosphodiesterase [Devosia sp. Leaf420]|uniref:glycerophosphodiester phosphodiesterase family protein n=1 Tax=Devosia sp. Leaf420 TaxID=1736374 RepID=UPI00071523A4|nr:glycerophosphodiester phosphodiesterase family protein [Devosia sp. Leaf420]KQT51511.1 glycerophosphodiester phosphodiesterase [Devosia sp. Leaf420]